MIAQFIYYLQHVMLYKWSLENCPNAKYVLKTDDDVFVDIDAILTRMKTYVSYVR